VDLYDFAELSSHLLPPQSRADGSPVFNGRIADVTNHVTWHRSQLSTRDAVTDCQDPTGQQVLEREAVSSGGGVGWGGGGP
jgi:hypothetical protein